MPMLSGELMVNIFKEGKTFVAYAPALDLSTCGKTRKKAEENFEEILEIFLTECVNDGTLGDVLASLGWQKRVRSWAPPKTIGHLSIPLPTLKIPRESHNQNTVKAV